MIAVKKINDMKKLCDILLEQDYDEETGRFRSTFLYRGLPDASYSLKTSLKRNCKEKQNELEKSILRNFTKYAAIEDPTINESIWRQLFIGQHHGLPTRVLDWTYSPLMAMHFATSGEDMAAMDKRDGAIWKIDIDEFNRMLPEKYKKALETENAYLFTVEMLSKLARSIDDYDKDMEDKSMLLIEPPSIDQRIINQYSYFSIVPKGIEEIEEFLKNKTYNTTKYIIDKSLKWRIRDMLDQMNINERIAYPGLDGLTMWLKRHYYVKREEELNMIVKPEFIFKYKAVEKDKMDRLREIICDNKLYFPNLEKLNDPLEGANASIELLVPGADIFRAAGQVLPDVKEMQDQYRVASFCSRGDSPQMWANYAGNYSGVCFVFVSENELSDIRPVVYTNQKFMCGEDGKNNSFYLEKAVEESLLYKQQDWAYESEWRIIEKTDEHHLKFSKECLVGVIIGHKCEEKIKIKEFCSEAEVPVFTTFVANDSYKINIVTDELREQIEDYDGVSYKEKIQEAYDDLPVFIRTL